jgi:hypothetical protein
MDQFTSRALADRIGISKGLAAQILALPGAPDPARFNNEATYLRRLARAAIKAGHSHDAIAALAMAPEPAKAKRDPPQDSPAPAPARLPEGQPTGDVTLDDLQASAATLRDIVSDLGKSIAKSMRGDRNPADVVALLDKFKGLQAELRQTIERLEQMRRDHLELLPRSDVYAAAGRMFQVVRGFADALIADLLTAGHLPAWIAGAGGVLPESSAATHHIQAELRTFAAGHFNRMADALGDIAVPLDDVPERLSEQCRQAMAAELERQAARLRASP